MRETGKTLRAGARLWLHVNVLKMAIAPVRAERPELLEALRGDLGLVLPRAAAGDGVTEVSAFGSIIVSCESDRRGSQWRLIGVLTQTAKA